MLATIKYIFLFHINFNIVYSFEFSQSCGKSKANSSAGLRIVGGRNAAPGEFPWQIILTWDMDIGGQRGMGMCGGTIINENWIMTAAHCVVNEENANKYKVYLGVHDLTRTNHKKVIASVEKLIHHQNYSDQTILNDIALVKIDGKLDFAGKHSNLAPLCLATPTSSLTNNCYATGFGLLYANKTVNGPSAKILQKVLEPIASGFRCISHFPDYNMSTNLCAGGLSSGGKAVCKGDSGGPLQCRATDGKWHQVGITSYGAVCALPNIPDVFTKVSFYNDWIREIIDSN